MSAAGQALVELVPHREVKTLLVDIERLPGSFTADFWDLNAFKNRRIHPDHVTAWPSTVCLSAQWYGEKRVRFHAAWETGGADAMYEAAFELYDQADLVITYNGVGFDNKHLVAGWAERNLGRPSTWRDIDLLKVVRQNCGWESKTLDSVCKRLGVPAKNDHYDIDIAKAAMAGDRKAQRTLKSYNVNDTQILAAVYERLLPYIKGHPHVAPSLGLERPTCPRCSSSDVQRVSTYTPGTHNYPEYRCNTCSGPFRTTFESRGPQVRAL